MEVDREPIRLSGFNNLTKCLSFNLYDFAVARNQAERESYVKYIDERFSAKQVTQILRKIAEIIDAEVISVSSQDYDPHGASSLVLMSDLGHGSVGAHLTKSHICAHTYPDWNDPKGVCSFRIDIDIATCGTIVPLRALNYLFESVENDVVIIDYVVRGFTRDKEGKRLYIDHEVSSIQDFIDPKIRQQYRGVDLTIAREQIWQSKMVKKQLEPAGYFAPGVDPDTPENKDALDRVRHEMLGVFEGLPE